MFSLLWMALYLFEVIKWCNILRYTFMSSIDIIRKLVLKIKYRYIENLCVSLFVTELFKNETFYHCFFLMISYHSKSMIMYLSLERGKKEIHFRSIRLSFFLLRFLCLFLKKLFYCSFLKLKSPTTRSLEI